MRPSENVLRILLTLGHKTIKSTASNVHRALLVPQVSMSVATGWDGSSWKNYSVRRSEKIVSS